MKFVKCNCNKEFKDIGKALGIKVARACLRPSEHGYRILPCAACPSSTPPAWASLTRYACAFLLCFRAATFHLYRQGKQLAVMTGAKVDELRELILAHK